MTLGVRGMVHDRSANSVFLIRHTYVPGWQFPGRRRGGRRDAGQALERELPRKATSRLPTADAEVDAFQPACQRRDHVAFYLIESSDRQRRSCRDREIAEAGFFPLDRLPDETTPATLRRIAEIFGGTPVSPDW